MEIGKEQLEEIVRRTVTELVKRLRSQGPGQGGAGRGASRPDQSAFRTPVLTLAMVERLGTNGTVTVARGTVVSPMAAERLAEKRIQLVRE